MALGNLHSSRGSPEEGTCKSFLSILYLEDPEKGYKSDLTWQYIIILEPISEDQ